MRRNCNFHPIQVKYLAPEVINQYYNNKCDIWSLGIVLYALLLGNAPFTGNSDEIII
jgi:calcium-dependent protein kinase